MKIRYLVAGLAMGWLLATASAHGATHYLGDFNGGLVLVPEDSVYHAGSSPFTDTLNFHVAHDAAMQGSFNDSEALWGTWSLLNLSNLDVDLWSGTSVSPGVRLSDLGAGDDFSFSTGVLSAGSYFFKVTGQPTGFLGGTYEFSVAAVPVPEPGEWLLLVAGIGLLGLLARRREEWNV